MHVFFVFIIFSLNIYIYMYMYILYKKELSTYRKLIDKNIFASLVTIKLNQLIFSDRKGHK